MNDWKAWKFDQDTNAVVCQTFIITDWKEAISANIQHKQVCQMTPLKNVSCLPNPQASFGFPIHYFHCILCSEQIEKNTFLNGRHSFRANGSWAVWFFPVPIGSCEMILAVVFNPLLCAIGPMTFTSSSRHGLVGNESFHFQRCSEGQNAVAVQSHSKADQSWRNLYPRSEGWKMDLCRWGESSQIAIFASGDLGKSPFRTGDWLRGDTKFHSKICFLVKIVSLHYFKWIRKCLLFWSFKTSPRICGRNFLRGFYLRLVGLNEPMIQE